MNPRGYFHDFAGLHDMFNDNVHISDFGYELITRVLIDLYFKYK